MSQTLPPCPFCAHEQVRIVDTTFETCLDGDEVTMDFAECTSCHLSMPVGNYRVLCELIDGEKLLTDSIKSSAATAYGWLWHVTTSDQRVQTARHMLRHMLDARHRQYGINQAKIEGATNRLQRDENQWRWLIGRRFRLGKVLDVCEDTATVLHGDDTTRILIAEIVEDELCRPDPISQALNEGDGVYRP